MSSLTSLPFYHGTIDTNECLENLQGLGDFLIRNHVKVMDKGEGGPHSCVLTMAVSIDQASEKEKKLPEEWAEKAGSMPRLKSYIIKGDPTGVSYTIEGTTESYATVQALCDAYIASKQPFPRGGILLSPIARKPWQLFLSDIEFPTPEIVLGSGSFGKVVKGKLLKQGSPPIDVAIKCSTDDKSDEIFSEMYAEARAMRALTHPNIIRLEGVIVEKLPILLVIEFMDGTCLLSALQKKKVSGEMRFPIVMGVLYGLLYMHINKYIHRDIAARNVMISHDCRKVKIIDFGLAKHYWEYKMKVAGKIPVKWLAPEVKKKWMFSTKTDTWAFGVTIWEIYHDGAEPYGNKPVSNAAAAPATPIATTPASKSKSKASDGTARRHKGPAAKPTKPVGNEKLVLPITENLEYLPKDFIPMYEMMFCKKDRLRIELAAMAHTCETKILPTLPPTIQAEVKIHMEKRPAFDPNFKVILQDRPDSIATIPTVKLNSPNTPNSKNSAAKQNESPNTKAQTQTRKRRTTGPSKSDGTKSGSTPEKKNDKTKTARRKK